MPAHSDDSCDSADGYRPNVAIVLLNRDRQVLQARRSGVSEGGWQFPQGGVHAGETLQDAAFREMFEEVGLRPAQVRLLGRTRQWLRYELPQQYRRPGLRGQKQMWFLFTLLADDSAIRLDHAPHPEFDAWRWADYWQPPREVITFKRDVYRQALQELQPIMKQCNE